MFSVQTLDKISPLGLSILISKGHAVSADAVSPHAILLRSFKMHDMPIPDSLQVVGRAGAGTNNIPVENLTRSGIPVLNTPGANANAVKELVIAGILLSARNICQAWHYVGGLDGNSEGLTKDVESGKKQFVGFELPGRTLGVIGLGAIGVKVANAALALGMKVVGYDPAISVQRAWEMNAGVKQAGSLLDLIKQADFISCNVPLIEATKGLIGKKEFAAMKKEVTLLNFARQEIIEESALEVALKGDKLRYYVCDFPSRKIKDHTRVIALPHLGASTVEAEENCAVMVSRQVDDYLQNGNIVNSVNFPTVEMPRNGDYRLTVVNKNIPNMLGQISTVLANQGLNILDMLNKSRGEIAYTLFDVEAPVSDDTIKALKAINGVVRVRNVSV